MITVHIDLCIRCRRALRNGLMLSSTQVASLIVCRELKVVDVKMNDFICQECRAGIGDDIADAMLKIHKGG